MGWLLLCPGTLSGCLGLRRELHCGFILCAGFSLGLDVGIDMLLASGLCACLSGMRSLVTYVVLALQP